jgi:DNA polymerase III subunit alpha
MIRDGGAREVELLLPKKYNASSQIAAAVKAVQGVVDVELV